MAFTRVTGKHRALRRSTRRNVGFAGVATLAVGGVIGGLSSPACAAEVEAPPSSRQG